MWAKSQKIAIKFIAFVNKVFAGWVEMAHIGKAGLGRQYVAERQADLLKKPHSHGGSCCLAVGASEDYQEAFKEFIGQSEWTMLWQEDYDYLNLPNTNKLTVLESDHPSIETIKIAGKYNRLDAWIVIQSMHEITKTPVSELLAHMNGFPGLQRRMEQIMPGLYSDYAHTPEKIRGGMSAALELAGQQNKSLVVVYEPLTDRRQHFMIDDYKDCFDGAKHVYWIPSYLAREDPDQSILGPAELITHLADPSIASAMERSQDLKQTIQKHLDQGDMVVGMAGGGGDSLDEWLRKEFTAKSD